MSVTLEAVTRVVDATTRSAPAGHSVGVVRVRSPQGYESAVQAARERLRSLDACPHDDVVRLTDRPPRYGTEYRVYGDSAAGVGLYVTLLVG